MCTSPLHQDLLKKARKEVPTGEAHGAEEIDGGERDKWLPRRWKNFGPILQLHERVKHEMRVGTLGQ
jgi:hypothetical protein